MIITVVSSQKGDILATLQRTPGTGNAPKDLWLQNSEEETVHQVEVPKDLEYLLEDKSVFELYHKYMIEADTHGETAKLVERKVYD